MGKIFFQPKENDLLSKEELISCKNDLLNDFSLTDNLDRAFQIFKDDEKFKKDEFKNILNGIEMIEKELLGTLEKNSIKYIDCINKPFDPNLHMAVFQEERDDIADQTVIQVFEKGYKFKEKVLRPAKVKVAKNDGEVEEPSESSNEKVGE